MINWLHSIFHDPARGWDPIPAAYATDYTAKFARVDGALLARFVELSGGLAGKQIADVGAGPGQYALEFARLGARVTCFDVSRRYLEIAQSRFQHAGLEAEFVIGYMDHIARLGSGRFDAIFNNICWYYCMNDLAFARALLASVRPSGVILVCVHTEASAGASGALRKASYWLNRQLYIKVGHVLPPRGRVASAFRRLKNCDVEVDYSDPVVDIVAVRAHPAAKPSI
jgi:2-polyprenyl-3-methyl-5-hydroxy-6-metoxy-1,4-benzoquinol methylase